MRNWVEDFDPSENDIQLVANNAPAAPPGLAATTGIGTEETGGAYITVSQQASEREHRAQVADRQQGGQQPLPTPPVPA